MDTVEPQRRTKAPAVLSEQLPSPRPAPAKGAPPPATPSVREGLVRDLCERLAEAVNARDVATARVAHRALGELLGMPAGDDADVVDLAT